MALTRRPNNVLQERVVLDCPFPGSGFTAAVAATGLITCVTNANMADTDYITIGDGVNVPVLYEYDKSANGVTAGRASWAAGASTAADVAATLKTAIEANQKAFTVTDNLDGTLTLAHKWPGLGGNVTITENVANAGFLVSGMSGGLSAVATAITATTVIKFHKCSRAFRVEGVQVISPTGLVANASHYYTITLKNGSTVMATWSTQTGQEGSLTADTFKTATLSATDANLVAAADDVLSLSLALTGTATLPSGRLVVHGRYI